MRVLLLGATGTIGQATVKALVQAGHEVVCLVRDKSGGDGTGNTTAMQMSLKGAETHFGDVLDIQSVLAEKWLQQPFDALVSCLASRNGTPRDAWAIDYQAHSAWLQLAKTKGIKQFVLLSALCVQKPLLEFQRAKLAFENELVASGLNYSIVRPTAFFKSLSGQIKRLKQGKPFLLFGDGQLTACKPISDQDLGQFIANCLTDNHLHRAVLPIGGPGPAITPLQQAQILFKVMGLAPRYKHVPVGFLDMVIVVLKTLGRLMPVLSDKAELAKIGRYYATESMLVWDPQKSAYDEHATPSFGSQTLHAHYEHMLHNRIDVDLGQHSVF
ncbi:MAG: NAD(P)H-binding protein [Burkholderiaceae bacterium]|jgi:divinyl chlorophyllide a 8-vinyl-reductase|nr:NAD(P)H-binding protein [Burkholderiaceae bacterium]